MLKRLYIDNWRCFANFEMPFEPIQCLAGSNGVGKSSVLDVLQALKSFVTRGATIASVLPTDSLTRGSKATVQRFELEVDHDLDRYRYSLTIEHDDVRRMPRVRQEALHVNGGKLFDFDMGQVQLYRDDHSVGPTFRFDWTLSGLGTVGVGQDNRKLDWFRRWLGGMRLIQINPFKMAAEADTECEDLDKDAGNFAAWYQHLALDEPEVVARLTERLKTVWPAFRSFRLERAGDRVRILTAQFHASPSDSSTVSYRLTELSDGQRCLIVLHALLALAPATAGYLLGIDEPVNFVTLPEIQPWLGDLLEAAEDGGVQLLLSGHHPDLLDYMGAERIRMLTRSDGGPTRVRAFSTDDESGLAPSELLSRSLEPSDA
jgi:predicted ATPase